MNRVERRTEGPTVLYMCVCVCACSTSCYAAQPGPDEESRLPVLFYSCSFLAPLSSSSHHLPFDSMQNKMQV